MSPALISGTGQYHSFQKNRLLLKLKEQTFIRLEAPFVEEISEMAIVKMLDK